MRLRNRIGRRWRSLPVRSGLWSALWVGLLGIAGSVFYSLVLLAPVSSIVVGGMYHTLMLDQIEYQITTGVEPGDLDVNMYHVDGPPGPPRWTFWALVDNGVVLDSYGEISSEALDGPYEVFLTYPEDRAFPRTVNNAIGTRWYVVERSFTDDDGRQLRAVAALEDQSDQRFQVEFDLQRNARTILTLMLGAFALTSVFTHLALRRVEKMRVAVQAITEDSLDQRVPVKDAADRIDKLAHTMNDMLERLETAAAQQNQFLADASHELRSPVAGLRAQLDVAAAYPERVDHGVLLPKLAAEVERLQRLVNDLLLLSRSEAETSEPGAVAIARDASVDAVLDAEVQHQQLIGARVELRVTSRSDSNAACTERDLERAIRNLVDNAVRHAATAVQIGSRRDGDNVVISVIDDGPGIPAADIERVFERFVRLDEARSRDAGGAGLGLAIARQLARKHGGDIAVLPTNSGAHFELTLPRTASTPAPARTRVAQVS